MSSMTDRRIFMQGCLARRLSAVTGQSPLAFHMRLGAKALATKETSNSGTLGLMTVAHRSPVPGEGDFFQELEPRSS